MDKPTTITNQGSPLWLKKIEVLHPYQMLLYLSMFGSLLIFVFLLFSWSKAFDTLPSGYFKLPASMYLNTFLLLTTFPLSLLLKSHFSSENLKQLKLSIHGLLYVLVVFTSIQFFSWKLLASEGIIFTGHAADGYLYIISGAHLLHLFGGIVLLLFAAFRIEKALKDPVSTLIYTTDAFEKLRLRLVSLYVHFLDFGWLLILVSLHYFSTN